MNSAQPGDTQAVLAEVERAFGFVPNLFRAYTAYPPLLAANWAKVRATILEGNLRREVKEAIALLISRDSACAYCIGAHTATLRMLGFSEQAVATMESTLEGEGVRPVTWVVVEDVASGAWGVGGQPITTEAFRQLAAQTG